MNQKKFGLNQLAVKIVNENEELLTKLDLWEKLKEEDAPMSDRMEVARLDEKIVKMIYRSLFYDYSNTSLYMSIPIVQMIVGILLLLIAIYYYRKAKKKDVLTFGY